MNLNLDSSSLAKKKACLRVRLYANDVRLVEEAVFQFKTALLGTNIEIFGPIPMKTKRKIFTVNRSPHVDKESREHFEIKKHVRLLSLSNCFENINDILSKITLPAGVEIKIKVN
jgi:small subunit ribosomal protein S10